MGCVDVRHPWRLRQVQLANKQRIEQWLGACALGSVESLAEPVASTTALVKAAQELDPGVQEFAEQVTGAGRRELGEWIADHVRLRRWRSQLKILQKAKRYADEAGFDPEPVALKTLAPLLEGASLEEEDDDDMSSRWAALLANAARPGGDVPPAFPDILSHLTPYEARLLDAVYENAKPRPRAEWLTNGLRRDGVAPVLGGSEDDVAVAVENLFRLRLCTPPAVGLGFTDHPNRQFLIAAGEELICLTPLGAAFVEACRRPE